MCECNYVYCVMDTSDPTPIGLRVFSSMAMADAYRKVLQEKYPDYCEYYVETLEIE